MTFLPKKIQFVLMVALLGVLFVNSRPACADEYNFTVVSYPGASSTVPQGINNSGDMWGDLGAPFNSGDNFISFLYRGGNYSLFPRIVDINDKGMILSSAPPAIYFDGQVTPVNVLGTLIAFNNNGTLLLNSGILKDGILTPIVYPGARPGFTIARDINDLDEVVGSYAVGDTSHGFLYKDGVYTTIDFPGSIYNDVTAINNNGVIVGGYSLSTAMGNPGFQGFVYQDGNYETFDAFNFYSEDTITGLTGINDLGEIVGYQTGGPFSGVTGFVATPVPEPGTLGLIGSGLLAFARIVRRRSV